MVDQVPSKEEASDAAHGESTNEKKASQGNTAFKKNGSRGSNTDKKTEGVPELLKGVGFSISRDGLDLYLKALKRMGLYVCATYKNGSELEICLDSEELIIPEEPALPENPTAHQWRMWELWAAVVVKNEEKLKQNIHCCNVTM